MDCLESQTKPASKGEEAEMETDNKENNKAEPEAEPEEKTNSPDTGYADNIRAAPLPLMSNGSQLTIFYNGSITVYNAVTPEKAQAIMLIAAAAAASAVSAKDPVAVGPTANAGATMATAMATALSRCLSQKSSTATAAAATAAAGTPLCPQLLAGPNASSLCKLQADLPIARRQSLQQFLEKRRSRLVSKAPYGPAKKSDEGMAVGAEGNPQLS